VEKSLNTLTGRRDVAPEALDVCGGGGGEWGRRSEVYKLDELAVCQKHFQAWFKKMWRRTVGKYQ